MVRDEREKQVDTPWMTVEEVARYLSVSPGTVRNWVSQKYIPHAKRGRVVRFHRSKIDLWLSRNSCPGRLTIAQRLTASAGDGS